MKYDGSILQVCAIAVSQRSHQEVLKVFWDSEGFRGRGVLGMLGERFRIVRHGVFLEIRFQSCGACHHSFGF